MSIRTVFVENNNSEIISMFAGMGWGVTYSLGKANLLVLDGGADVTPALYGEVNTNSHSFIHRDIQSLGLIRAADMLRIPVAGICRGGQILHVYDNGKMKQHIEGHGRSHMVDYRGDLYHVTSTHHQMMVVDPILMDERFEHTRMAMGYEVYYAVDGTTEIIFNEGHKHLSFQPHPEYESGAGDCRTLFFKLIGRLMGDK